MGAMMTGYRRLRKIPRAFPESLRHRDRRDAYSVTSRSPASAADAPVRGSDLPRLSRLRRHGEEARRTAIRSSC